MADRFHINSDLSPGFVQLSGPEAHHLGVVCRAKIGDMVNLFNGNGLEYRAVIREISKREITLEIQEVLQPQRELPFPLHLAVALPRGDRGDFIIEKATELGVTCLTLLTSSRTQFSPGEGKRDKLRHQVIEACKQCGRNVLMAVEGPESFDTYIQRQDLPSEKWIAHPGGDQGLPHPSSSMAGKVVLIGPEGGFTEAEVDRAMEIGWRRLGLGPRILRVETAAIAAAVLLGLNSDREAREGHPGT